MRPIFVILIAFLLLNACAPLSKTQVKLTHNYFETVTNYPNYYRFLNTSIAELTLDEKNLQSSLQKSDSARVDILIASINSYEESLKLPDTIFQDIRYVEQYIQDYFLLLPNGFNVYQALKGTTETISGIFGLGGLVNGLLPSTVPGLNPTKRRKIKAHIYNSDEKLIQSLRNIKSYVDLAYITSLEQLDIESIRNFELLLNTINKKTEPIDYYNRYNRMLTEYYSKLFLTKSLARNLSTSIDAFLKAEDKLTSSLRERKKIDPETPHLSELVRNIQRIQSIIDKLEGRNK